ncbi:F-box/FBD/LRR-repeat protein At3g26920-like [Silene latifolia]|uniref:F-box/FBD/LRR-repeat protein At3g26920-like n=1 Tax=Silene latifolia TaxID=37657 RepID=UPI003D76F8C5
MDGGSEKRRDFYQRKTFPFSSSSSCSGKQLTSMKPGKDRLSEMPDEILVHILSYLPTAEAVRTMLIRPFGNLWTLIPSLEFEYNEVLLTLIPDGTCSWDDVRRFFTFVRNVLILHKRPFIDEFGLYIISMYSDERRSECGDDIRMCLKFALDKQAKAIYFTEGDEELSESSDYPNFISESLITLQLAFFIIYPELQVDLGSLKELTLNHVTMTEEGFQQFISGCPSLQVLHLYNPYEIRTLSFSVPNIRKLFLCFEKDDPDTDPWVLDFPNLKSLDLCLYGIPNVYHINFSSVRYVKLEVFNFEVDDENKLRMFKLFLEKLSQSEVFRLSDHLSEIFLHLLEDLHLLQIRWKRVVLPLGIFCQSCLLGVYGLMRSSKDLEELDIYTNTTSACRASVDLPPVELSNPCVMPKLKTVTLYGFEKPWKHQLQLVEFLLKSATALEKLVIVPNEGQFSITEKQDFVMHVSSFQRSSPSARVLFL